MTTPVLQDRSVPARLREARRQLVSNGRLPSDLIQSDLARSWERSWQAGLPATLPRARQITLDQVGRQTPVADQLAACLAQARRHRAVL